MQRNTLIFLSICSQVNTKQQTLNFDRMKT